MKLQLSQTRIVPDAVVAWSEHGEDVDVVQDLKALSFRPGSIEEMYSFHVVDHLFPEEIVPALLNWRNCLVDCGRLYLVVDDFEYIARAFVGNDITIELMNERYSHPSQHTQTSLVEHLRKVGFKEGDVNVWFADVPGKFKKQHYELVLEATKHD